MAKSDSITQNSLFSSFEYRSGSFTIPPIERFWRFVPDLSSEACWEWLGNRHLFGYGNLKVRIAQGSFQVAAHRMSWMIHFGDIPDGLMVCHSCDNPPCVNPLHLFLGNSRDNVWDMRIKKRGTQIKLSEEDVLRIRGIQGRSRRSIANEFGVSPTLILMICRGEKWPHIRSDPPMSVVVETG